MDSKATSKQVFWFAVINYIGTAIGVVSVLFIYPYDKVFLGTVRYIDNVAQFLYPIMVMGASQALIKFYPGLDEQQRNRLFNYSMLSVTVVSLLVLVILPLFVGAIRFEDSYILYFAFPIAVALAFVELFRKQAQDLQKIAVPALFEKLIPKIVLPLLFLLMLNHAIGFYPSLYFYTGGYVLVFVLTAVYLFRRFRPGFTYKFDSLFKEIERKEYLRYSMYALAGSLGSLLAFRIDGIIIPEFISKEANGSFSIAVTLAQTLQIPAVGMFAIYGPIVSNLIKQNGFGELSMKYKEIARLLLFIGGVLYSCIALGLIDLFSLLPTADNLQASVPVIYILGFSVLLNMATGFNSEIITYSKHFRFNLVAVVLLTLLNISLNLFFIFKTDLGILGVAYASLISMTIFNAAKLWFIHRKFGILPFDAKFMKLALLFAVSGLLIYLLPDTGSNFINLIYKVGLSLAINIFTAYKLKLVYQVNVWIDKTLAILRLK